MVPGLLKTDIHGIDDWVKLHAKALIEDQLKEMQSTNLIMTLSVRWKNPLKSAITLDPDDVEDAKDVDGNTNDSYTVESIYSGHLVMAYTFS